jgi:hypothetical protein
MKEHKENNPVPLQRKFFWSVFLALSNDYFLIDFTNFANIWDIIKLCVAVMCYYNKSSHFPARVRNSYMNRRLFGSNGKAQL